MNKLLISLLFTVMSLSATAADRVNSKESLRVCKSAVKQDFTEATVKFKNKTATSVDSEFYTHYINILEKSDSGKALKKLLCKTTRTGEVVELAIEPGRWKI